MAFVLNNMGYSVLVNDRSKEKELADVISFNDFSAKIKTYKNVDFNFSEDILEGYDFVLNFYTEFSKEMECASSQYMVLNISVLKSEMRICQQIVNSVKSDMIVVIRDRIRKTGDKKYIKRLIITPETLADVYTIKLDKHDKKYQYRMDYGGVSCLEYLSENYIKVLIRTICTITGREKGSVKKALKYVREGRISDRCF